MMGHIKVAEWGNAPASVNPRAYAYLRETLGFDGLAVTDAMNMGAITDRYAQGAATVAALSAGADLVVMPANLDKAIAGIVARSRTVHSRVSVWMRQRRESSHLARSKRESRGVRPLAPRRSSEGSIVVAAQNCEALIGST